ncbi:hypothetical protein J6X90_03770 [Candidatus Saccharibacteria bacterium]|nr:hypothetical protein [Candidatus Saccharibacteria bacterium]
MKSKQNQFCLTKLLEYAVSIDLIWLVIWGTIFVSFVALDSIFQTAYPGKDVFYDFGNFRVQVVGNGTFIGVTILKYIGIVLSFIYAKKKFPKDYILQIALAFTLLADTILTFDQISKLGVLAFCIAQYFHIARFAKIKPKYFVMWTLFLFLLLISGRILKIESMFVLAFIYALSLSMNIILTRQWWKRVKNKKQATDREVVASTCAMAGFILFALCDTNVALSYLSVTGAIPLFIARYANFFAWLFYYPSQVLISNSSVIIEAKTRKVKNVSPSK